MTKTLIIAFLLISGISVSCRKEKGSEVKDSLKTVKYSTAQFMMGADLSYVNQILDHGGVYKDSGKITDPYKIFHDNGTNLVRLRLWHHPAWTMEVYGTGGTQMYNDIRDVAKAIAKSRQQGMDILLDLHYSDTWADPGKQIPPEAWKNITDLMVLKDSVYQYTYKVLQYLKSLNLFPEMIQVGNEINCGLLQTNTGEGFPALNCCEGHWTELGEVLNSGIRAIREISTDMTIKPSVVLHVADPKNVEWWFDNIGDNGKVTDFDIIGISYYPLWHTTISYDSLQALITDIKKKFRKRIMILETAYPWTKSGADDYNNSFGSQSEVDSFGFTKEGQHDFMIDFTQKMISSGVSGIVYWEPAWITSQMKDLWGTGSSWENSTLFDFEGNVLPSFRYMNFPYVFPE